MPSSSRSLRLDLLRALAVFLVLGRHMHPLSQQLPEFFQVLSRLWQRAGWMGVDLFFVVSGFLVSGLIFSEYRQHRALNLWRFYARRGLKIYPAFYLLLLSTVIVTVQKGKQLKWPALLSEIFFVQNYRPGLWNHTWSLAVEEHFYLLLPLLLLYLAKTAPGSENPFGLVPKVFALLAGGALLYRCMGAVGIWNHFRLLD